MACFSCLSEFFRHLGACCCSYADLRRSAEASAWSLRARKERDQWVGRNWIRQGDARTNCSSYCNQASLACGSAEPFPAGDRWCCCSGRQQCEHQPSTAVLLRATAGLCGFALSLPHKGMQFPQSSSLATSFSPCQSIPKVGMVKRFFFTEHVSLVEPLKEKFTCQMQFLTFFFSPGILLGTGRKIHWNLCNWTGLGIQMRFPYLAASLQQVRK